MTVTTDVIHDDS